MPSDGSIIKFEIKVYKSSYQWLIDIKGIGAHVKNTVTSRKNLRPHTSDNAPIRGALRKDNIPYKTKERIKIINIFEECYSSNLD